jgi:hypothetical protein
VPLRARDQGQLEVPETGADGPLPHWSWQLAPESHSRVHAAAQRTPHVDPGSQWPRPRSPTTNVQLALFLQITRAPAPAVSAQRLVCSHVATQLVPQLPTHVMDD